MKEEKTNIIQKKRCVLLWTYFEQLHSRHLVRSLTGSCTACGCLQEHSGLHIVTSNPFLSVQQAVKKDYLVHGCLPPREEGLAYFFWPSKHVDIVGTLATVLERHHQGQHCHCKKNHLWAGCLPKSPVLQLYQFVLSIQVVAKAARKSPKSFTDMLIRILCKSAFSYLEHSYFLLSFHKVT